MHEKTKTKTKECRENKELCSDGPYPTAYVSAFNGIRDNVNLLMLESIVATFL